MNYHIRPMTLDDYDEVLRLWTETEGMELGEDDGPEQIQRYLDRNIGLCFVAISRGVLVGTVLCGHEGRRGILRHLTVKAESRGKGIARALVEKCLEALSRQGIKKCNIFVLDETAAGLQFWEHMGWYRLEDNYRTLQHVTEAST